MIQTAAGINCGIGNLLGLQQAGFQVKYLIDDRIFQKRNQKTWSYHFPGIKLHLDPDKINTTEKVDIIAASPSCAQLSLLGVKRKDRSELKNLSIMEFDFIRTLVSIFENDPEFIIIEYIPRLLTYFKIQRNGILHPFSGKMLEFPEDYRVYYEVMNSIHFGVPQIRKRLFLIFSKKKYNFMFVPPNIDLYNELTVNDVIEGLNQVRDIIKTLKNDEIPNHTTERKEGFAKLKPGESYYGTQNNKRLDPNKVCPVITSSKTRHVHPYEPRTLTVRECATFQGFPLDFEFFGSFTDSLDLIGKTVPPPVFFEIGKQIMKSIKDN